MTNEEMFEKVREDRPHQIIHEVIDFEKNEYGFYDVTVDMQVDGANLGIIHMPTIRHSRMRLPYPISEYEKLTVKEQFEWRWGK